MIKQLKTHRTMNLKYNWASSSIKNHPDETLVAFLPPDLPQHVALLLAGAPQLLMALEAIKARIDGEYDHPALVAFGALRVNTEEDILEIATQAIASVPKGPLAGDKSFET
jgi:hypothetical protein